MFTGLVEAIGIVSRIEPVVGGAHLEVYAPDFGRDMAIGDSVATDGACLTIAKFARGSFVADLSSETIDRTTLGKLRVGSKVNLERALRFSDRLGGHLVSGHIDGVGRLVQRHVSGNSTVYQFEVPENLAIYLVEKGSVAINGVSLTITKVNHNMIACAVISHTELSTTLADLVSDSPVNIEVDMIGKYVQHFVNAYQGGESDQDAAGRDSRIGGKLRDFLEG